jgi:hypothetical protein
MSSAAIDGEERAAAIADVVLAHRDNLPHDGVARARP